MRNEQEIVDRLKFIESVLDSDLITGESEHDLRVMADTIRWALGIIDDDGNVIGYNEIS